MTYASGGLIQATDYNTIANGDSVDYRVQNMAQTGTTQTQGGVYTKTSATAAWDAQVHSYLGYSQWVRLKATMNQTNGPIMVGLNSDPALNASYASIDYAFYATSSGVIQIYENGALVIDLGIAYTTSTIFEITYQGDTITYWVDGVSKRTVARAVSGQLFFDSSIYSTNTSFKLHFFGSLDVARERQFYNHSGCSIVGTTITKTGGTNAVWDASVYAWPGYYNYPYVSAKASQTNGYVMFGLNSDPDSGGTSYNSIDYAWYFEGNGAANIYENGSFIVTAGAYTTSTVLSMYYDGANVFYYKDGTLIRKVARALGAPLYFDSSFYGTGNAINSVVYINKPNIKSQWGVGYGSVGLGQDVSSFADVAVGSSVTAAQWTNMIQKTNACLAHQGVTQISPTSVTTGNIITAYDDIIRGSAQAMGYTCTTGLATTDAAPNTLTYTGTWGNTGNRILQSYITYTFASSNAARYFFNAGGKIKLFYARSGGSATVRNTDWTNFLTAVGTLEFSGYNMRKLSGSGSPTNLANNGNGGYWNSSEWWGNAWQLQFRQNDTAAGYTDDRIDVYIGAVGATVSILTYMVNGHVQAFQDAVDGTTTASTVISSPSTTYLVNTWGTPTFSGTLTPI